jgi:hypothetical protein
MSDSMEISSTCDTPDDFQPAPTTPAPTETENMVRATLPYSEDSKKSKYLSYRLMNFTPRESMKLAKVASRTRDYWIEKDPMFVELDNEGLTDRRKQLAAEYLNIEFTRNFRMVLEKDFQVLYKALTDDLNMSKNDTEYLMRLRGHYTPQHLAMIKSLMGEKPKEDSGFDFTKMVISMKMERESVTIEGRR